LGSSAVAAGAATAAATVGLVGILVLATTAKTGNGSLTEQDRAEQASQEPPVEGATVENPTRKGTKIWGKSGDLGTAEADFENMHPTQVRTYGNGTTVGELANGDTVNVRGHSDDGRPTLEIQHKNGTVTKVRYSETHRT
jgi:hypothetical protein